MRAWRWRPGGWACSVPFALCLLALIGCGGSGGGADGGRRDSGGGDAASDAGPTEPFTLSIATWNVENLFDSRNDPATADEVPSAAQVATKLTNVGRVIRALDADVVVLQEVENLAILEQLADGELSGMGYDERVLMDGFDPRGIDVGFLSRLPVTRVAGHTGESFPSPADETTTYFFARDAVEVFVDAGGYEVIVMGVHLISQLEDNDDRRLAEALQIRRIVDRRVSLGSTLAVVAGDMNDEPGSPALQALLAEGGLRDVTTPVPASDRWTTQFGGVERQFDFLLATPRLAGGLVTTDVRVLHGPEVDAASDHEPVLARFVLTP